MFDLGKSGEGKRNDPLSFIWLKRNGGKKWDVERKDFYKYYQFFTFNFLSKSIKLLLYLLKVLAFYMKLVIFLGWFH